MVDYAEILCEAVDGILTKRLEEISFDTTIVCSITDTSQADDGIYTVSNGSASFYAYSENTKYKVNDSVYVVIPKGDYDAQKMIIGKCVSNSATTYTFRYPFDSLVAVSNNLIKEPLSASLLANSNGTEILLWESENANIVLSGYSRLGLQANFRSWLDSFNVASGEYGLRLDIDATRDFSNNDAAPTEQHVVYHLFLDTTDMYGDPYNFVSYFQQEKVFDISSFGIINSLKLYFVQANNFIDKDGERIAHTDFLGNELSNNLFVNDIYLTVGYDLNEFDTEKAMLYSVNNSTYSANASVSDTTNRKEIFLRWIHVEDNDIKLIDETSEITNYSIKWYRYKLGYSTNEDDPSAGVYWEPVQTGRFSYILNPDVKLAEEKVKVIITHNDVKIYSNILTFTNENDVVNSAVEDYVNGLNIWCMDGSRGNYMIYGPDFNALDSYEVGKDRVLQAQFDSGSFNEANGKALLEAEQITWRIPKTSMIIPKKTNHTITTDSKFYIYTISPVRSAEDAQLTYRLYQQYNASYVGNNYIECEIIKNRTTYGARKEFTFGIAGTSGTDCTLVIDMDNRQRQVLYTGDSENYYFTAHLYDSTNSEVDLSPSTYTCTWGWHSSTSTSRPTIRTDSKTRIYLTPGETNVNQFLILQCTISGFGDYALTAYYPIPITNQNGLHYISGPTTIVYNTVGYPTEVKIPYEAHWSGSALTSSWAIESNGEEDKFIGALSNKNYLQPASIYYEGTKCYGVKLVYSNSKIAIQPIVIMQNLYPSKSLNEWTGKKVEITDGEIIAPAISAGKKNSDDNTFSGVMLGDFSATNTDSALKTGTGVYGINHGSVSYALQEDGTMVLGKAGQGRILFDGNNSTITSVSYGNGTGVYLDLDSSPFMTVKNDSNIIFQVASGGTTIAGWNVLSDRLYKDSVYLYSSTSDNVSIAGSGNKNNWRFRSGTTFGVDSEGNLFAENATVKGAITATVGFIGNWKIADGNIVSNNNSVTLNGTTGAISGSSISGGQISIGDHFSVDTDGNITATGGSIGSITLGTTGLYYSGDSTDVGFGLWKHGAHGHDGSYITFHAGGNNSNIGGAKFRVYEDGHFVATNANITGTITANSGTFSGKIIASSGTIGGWTIGSNKLYSTSDNAVELDGANGSLNNIKKISFYGSNNLNYIKTGEYGSYIYMDISSKYLKLYGSGSVTISSQKTAVQSAFYAGIITERTYDDDEYETYGLSVKANSKYSEYYTYAPNFESNFISGHYNTGLIISGYYHGLNSYSGKIILRADSVQILTNTAGALTWNGTALMVPNVGNLDTAVKYVRVYSSSLDSATYETWGLKFNANGTAYRFSKYGT